MGEALGQLYVEKYFPPAAKKRMDELVKNLMVAYRERIETRDWMGPETKKQALAKLAAVMPKIGYPDKWRDYSKLEYRHRFVRAKRAAGRGVRNAHGNCRDCTSRSIATNGSMTPPTVNAYYNPNAESRSSSPPAFCSRRFSIRRPTTR